MNDLDLRLIKPIKRIENFKSETKTVYIIPCRLIEINERINSKAFRIKIERLDFYSGKLIIHKAITWEKTLQIFDELNCKLPFITECKFYYNENGLQNFVVYGKFNTSGIVNLFDEDIEDNKIDLSKIYNDNYSELRNWIKTNENGIYL
ncbi:hypothetical protein NAT47_08925 [Flavobacterium sp. HXWNR69]|uniref:Uncharacterized protein n=1 Tax=Flavobacterium fragile TaxID=2949085 RepID=A0ABT0THT3_9FLAO|nr:hypothetical protein [Flavobacterium sp. HXWNR69]MCL9770540.1 hypothetical protein [Flavobacterium sp. HXWNR69]